MEPKALRWREGIALAVLLLFCAAVRICPLQHDYSHPDEVISVEVAHRVVATGSLDTNWKNAVLPVDFKLPQYNFSAYLLSAAAIDGGLKAFGGDEPRDTLFALRAWSALLGVGVAVLTFFVGLRLFGFGAGFAGAFLVAVNPLLAQDSLYARPEPFVTVLALLLVLVTPPRIIGSRLAAAGLIGGIAVATKISMLGILPLLFLPGGRETKPAFWEGLRAYGRRVLVESPARALIAVPAVAVGFGATAPFALVNPSDYAEGISFLFAQYRSPQWPFGLGEAPPSARLLYVGAYFAATTGAVTLLLSLGGAVSAALKQDFRALGIFVCAAVFAVWFATYPTFFERNFSHLMPLVLIFAGHGMISLVTLLRAATPQRAAFGLILLGAAAFPAIRTTTILLAEEAAGRSNRELGLLRERVLNEYRIEPVTFSADENYASLRNPDLHYCRPWLVEMVHFHSKLSDAALPRVTAELGFTEVGKYTSKFAYVPTSSLHTYTVPTIVYLYRPEDRERCNVNIEDATDARIAGEPLDVLGVEATSAWTENGAFPSALRFAPAGSFGSWSGNDSHMGTLRLAVRVEGQDTIVLPYVTGPGTAHQSIRISDRSSGREIWKMKPATPASQWTYVRIALPEDTREIILEAADEGPAWGEWEAVAPPRKLRK